MRGEVYGGRQAEGGGRRWCTQRAGERARLQIEGRARGEERTWNISFMSLTLEVSKLSGWLKADASCRESNRKRGDMRAAARREGATSCGGSLAGGTRRAHAKHCPHVRDLGRVPVQRLVERSRSLE